jgi:hypothetical protein
MGGAHLLASVCLSLDFHADATNQGSTSRAVLPFIFDLTDQPFNSHSKEGATLIFLHRNSQQTVSIKNPTAQVASPESITLAKIIVALAYLARPSSY